MKWFGNDCGCRRESLSLLAAKALPETEVRVLETHIARCAECRQYLAEIRGVVAPIADWEKSFDGIEPTKAARERWQHAMQTAMRIPVQIQDAKSRVRSADRWSAVSPTAQSANATQAGGLRHSRPAVCATEVEHRTFFHALWSELIWPARRAWIGLATIWLALVIFHFSQTEQRSVVMATSKIPAADWSFALKEQQRVLGEILGPLSPVEPAEPARRHSNQPRSERRVHFLLV